MNNIQKLLKTYLAFSFFIAGFYVITGTSHHVHAATDGSFDFVVPKSGNLVDSCTYSMDLQVDTGSNNSNAADVIITYDPTKIDIIDSIKDEPGKQIQPGNAYQAYFGNVVDESSGTIRLTGSTFTGSFTGSKIFATISFKSKPGVGNASFEIAFDGPSPTNSKDSNIAIAETSLDALGSVTNATMTFSPGSCITDKTPPGITFIDPKKNESNVALNQNVQLKLSDSLSGVNPDTLEMTINGLVYTSTDTEVTITGSTNNYTITIDPREDFYDGSPSSIVVTVDDFAGNTRQSSITFNYPPPPPPPPAPEPDRFPPIIDFISPTHQQTITEEEAISIIVSDQGDGVDITTVVIYINDRKYTVADSTVTYTGNPGSYTITIKDSIEYSQVAPSYMYVFASDLAGNDSYGNILFNIPEAMAIEDVKEECNCAETIEDKVDELVENNQVVRTYDSSIPLSEQIKKVEDSLIQYTPDALRPVIKSTGLLGILSVLLGLPIAMIALWLFVMFLMGLIPYILGVLSANRDRYSRIIDSKSGKGIVFAKLIITSTKTNKAVRKSYSGRKGKVYVKLERGIYVFRIIKDGNTLDTFEYEQRFDGLLIEEFSVSVPEQALMVERFQFEVISKNPKVISLYCAALLAVMNVIFVRTTVAILILIAVFIAILLSHTVFYSAFRSKTVGE
ncbi:MAG: Ig-like domain-containing protein [Candidatus Dojkabacteria bacterium]